MTEIPDDVVEMLWRDLCEKSDRTSPAEHPDMVLVTLDELRAALRVGVEWERDRYAQKIAALERLVEALQQKWPTSAAMDHFHK